MPLIDAKSGKAYLLLALAGLSWSGTHIVGRAMAGHVPPYGATFIRWSVPILILLPFAWPHLKRDWATIKRHWLILACFGVPGGPIFAGLQYTGLQYTEALNASIMNSVSPVLVAAFGALLFRDRLGWLQALGITISLGGVITVVSRGDLDVIRTLALNFGDVLLIINQSCWAVYTTCLRLRPAIHWISFLFLICVFSTIGVLPFWFWEMQSGYVFQPTLLTYGALAYMAIFSGMVAFACFNIGTELIGPIRAAPFTHLIPLFSAILSILFLGEYLQAFHVIGFLTILAGVWLAARGKG
jgi:drug/metabolite transporter (DMT)-like permease